MTISLRPATEADARTVSRLFDTSFRDTFGGNYPPDELNAFLAGFDDEYYRRAIASTDSAILLGLLAGTVSGYCFLGRQALPVTSDRPWWVLGQLYLLQPAKGTGMADALLEWAVSESRLRGMEELYLTVWINNPRARRLYERHGFVECGKYPYRVGSVTDDDRIMRLAL